MRSLVFGASGFLGRSIAELLIARGEEVFGTYHSNREGLPEGCRPIATEEIFGLSPIDHVVLAAGNHALPMNELIDANVTLTVRASSAFPHARLLFVSSVAVYGVHTGVISEESAYNEPTPYGLVKLAGEAVARTHPRHAIVRPTYLFGAEMPSNSFVPAIVRAALHQGSIMLYGRGERAQDYLHVADAAQLCVQALSLADGGVYLGATGHSLTNLEVAQLVQRHVPGCRIEFAGADTAPSFRFATGEAERRLGWHPERMIADHIEELL